MFGIVSSLSGLIGVLGIVISIAGLLKFLLMLAVLALFILGVRWLCAKMGWTIPEPVWAILGFILCILLALAFFTGSGIQFS